MDANKSGTSGNSGIFGKDCRGGNKLVIGGSTQAGNAKVAKFAALQAYSIPKDLSQINAEQAHGFLMRNPHLAVPDWVF